MDVKQYYADTPPTIVTFAIKSHFDALTEQQKLYAHHLSRLVTIDKCFKVFRLCYLRGFP